MRTKLTLIWALLLIGYSAFARLGENKDQIFKRYGTVQSRNETSTNEWTGVYEFKEYKIVVYFKDNLSVGEFVSPIEQRDFSEPELKSLMTAIGGEGDWVETSGLSFMSKTWKNTKTKAIAYHKESIASAGTLVICTPDLEKKFADAHEKKEKAKADGF